ncbi:hypothetical protein TPHA_0B01240 [Tetrapisispora phaffii CBS 4417]|uniref:Uncharacterized protein n=1 Tax=Tetrapisispora phaffii (strain ATCC 24235 / CBS 4417 / NBRC 1672 / NRRL Y-8282 / UCD 70-5) TaxID=1071381 RepID=G8BP65_TETPH|nr:hypothetical protein TPHA_0B01240 [Tetrapisispora phaffii CBS 4417]CCE61796.1 hypothetical protein TPHA_0B01240 [Tetrapisispora phaffii CBS 4417]
MELESGNIDKTTDDSYNGVNNHDSRVQNNNASTIKLRRSGRTKHKNNIPNTEEHESVEFAPEITLLSDEGFRKERGKQYRTRQLSTASMEDLPLSDLTKIKTEDIDKSLVAELPDSQRSSVNSTVPPVPNNTGVPTSPKIQNTAQGDRIGSLQNNQANAKVGRKRSKRLLRNSQRLSKLTKLEKVQLKKRGVCLRCRKGKHSLNNCPISISNRNISH